MTVIAADFYNAHIDREREYVRVYAAYEVRAGQEMSIGHSHLIAPEDGYVIDRNVGFLSKEKFAAQTASAENLELPLPKKDLDEEALKEIEPVKKGITVMMDMGGGLTVCTPIKHDGFIVTKKHAQLYLSNFELTSQFNYAGRKYATEKETVVTMNDEMPLRGIILDKETTLSFEGFSHTAPSGSLLYPDPESRYGYSVQSPVFPLNTQLRLSADWTANRLQAETARSQHDAALGKQAKLNAYAPRLRLK